MSLLQSQLDEIARLHGEGLGRNAISRQMKIGQRQVSEAAEEMGLSFDRSRTERATRVRQADNDDRRQRLMEGQLLDALKFRDHLYKPCTIGQFGGRDNTWNEVTLDRPHFQDQLRLQQAINGATNNVLRLLEAQAGANRNVINLVLATAEKLGLSEKDGE